MGQVVIEGKPGTIEAARHKATNPQAHRQCQQSSKYKRKGMHRNGGLGKAGTAHRQIKEEWNRHCKKVGQCMGQCPVGEAQGLAWHKCRPARQNQESGSGKAGWGLGWVSNGIRRKKGWQKGVGRWHSRAGTRPGVWGVGTVQAATIPLPVQPTTHKNV